MTCCNQCMRTYTKGSDKKTWTKSRHDRDTLYMCAFHRAIANGKKKRLQTKPSDDESEHQAAEPLYVMAMWPPTENISNVHIGQHFHALADVGGFQEREAIPPHDFVGQGRTGLKQSQEDSVAMELSEKDVLFDLIDEAQKNHDNHSSPSDSEES